jgi:hypothetical protein
VSRVRPPLSHITPALLLLPIDIPNALTALLQRAVARGNLSLKIESAMMSGEMLELVNTINAMIDELSIFASDVDAICADGKPEVQDADANAQSMQGVWRSLKCVLGFSSRFNVCIDERRE